MFYFFVTTKNKITMNSSFLSNLYDLSGLICTRAYYNDNEIVLNVERRHEENVARMVKRSA